MEPLYHQFMDLLYQSRNLDKKVGTDTNRYQRNVLLRIDLRMENQLWGSLNSMNYL